MTPSYRIDYEVGDIVCVKDEPARFYRVTRVYTKPSHYLTVVCVNGLGWSGVNMIRMRKATPLEQLALAAE